MIGYYRLMRGEPRPADPAMDALVLIIEGQGVAIRWLGERPSWQVYRSAADFRAVHHVRASRAEAAVGQRWLVPAEELHREALAEMAAGLLALACVTSRDALGLGGAP